MKNLKPLFYILVGVILLAACGIASKYNIQNYPDSLIIKAFKRANVNPETFSNKVLRSIKAEIVYGKFTKQEAIDYISGWLVKVDQGIAYQIVGDLVDHYTKELFLGDNVSEAAILAYYVFMPDISILNIPDPIGEQDKQVTRDFLNYILNGLKTFTPVYNFPESDGMITPLEWKEIR